MIPLTLIAGCCIGAAILDAVTPDWPDSEPIGMRLPSPLRWAARALCGAVWASFALAAHLLTAASVARRARVRARREREWRGVGVWEV